MRAHVDWGCPGARCLREPRASSSIGCRRRATRPRPGTARSAGQGNRAPYQQPRRSDGAASALYAASREIVFDTSRGDLVGRPRRATKIGARLQTPSSRPSAGRGEREPNQYRGRVSGHEQRRARKGARQHASATACDRIAQGQRCQRIASLHVEQERSGGVGGRRAIHPDGYGRERSTLVSPFALTRARVRRRAPRSS